MDCEKLRSILDAYIDGELSAEEERAFREHAQACEACREELEAAELLRDALMHMDDDIVVPLEAQASWRRAVRAEAKKKNVRKWTQIASAAAAALVLLVGSAAYLGGNEAALPGNPAAGVPELASVEYSDAVIARDGVDEQSVSAFTENGRNASTWKKVVADDFDGAIETLRSLAAEYSGTFEANSEEAVLGARECVCRIELPYEYMADFLNAASRIGTELDSEIVDAQTETALIYIQIHEAGQE